MTKEDKNIFKNRIKAEHIFNNLKMYKRLQIRYDKKSILLMGFVYLAILDDFIKRNMTN